MNSSRGFCKRNLKPPFILLVVLIVTTFAWAIISNQKDPQLFGWKLDALRARKQEPGGKDVPAAAAAPPPAPPLSGSPAALDAVTMATPFGGIKVIAQPRRARIRLVGARPRSHVFSTVAGLVLPSVVRIRAVRNPRAVRPFRGNRQLRFAEPFARDGGEGGGSVFQAIGSGFVVDHRGYVLTNHHVVAEATEMWARVAGKINKDFPATLVGTDREADLALIKLSDAPTLPEVRLGDSSSAQVGEWVLAFGSPFGLDQTVTQGIISNRRASLLVDGISFGEMLQTDAPINRGSSGGPLVNMRAEVVGVNTAIYGPDGLFSGTGFAVPIDRANDLLARHRDVLQR